MWVPLAAACSRRRSFLASCAYSSLGLPCHISDHRARILRCRTDLKCEPLEIGLCEECASTAARCRGTRAKLMCQPHWRHCRKQPMLNSFSQKCLRRATLEDSSMKGAFRVKRLCFGSIMCWNLPPLVTMPCLEGSLEPRRACLNSLVEERNTRIVFWQALCWGVKSYRD
ncbi:hypothetical protein BDU57DRAFT_510412 [Ampelomyces quisqualis]|uniref:Uncharacterized protein n=1 Tax=Ampelomyces quisqualis TaxID=50730 RepID=A0A6A5R0H0_AMPQU|nr:hypothetical protein BDU57DRAFT_510412 [Ampelomyces quisqualis]